MASLVDQTSNKIKGKEGKKKIVYDSDHRRPTSSSHAVPILVFGMGKNRFD